MANYITKAKPWLVEVLRHLGQVSDWIMNQKSPEGSERKLRSNVSSDTLKKKRKKKNVKMYPLGIVYRDLTYG